MKKYTTSQRLKEIMNDKGIKQIDILNRIQPICKKWNIKMGSNDLSQYVTGKVEPSQKKLSVLAEALDTNEVWLMGYDVPSNRNLTVEDFKDIEQYSTDIINDTIIQKYNNLNQFSIKTGIPDKELKVILNNNTKLPKPIYLKKIADALGVDVTDYFIGAGYIESSDIDEDLYNSGIRYLLEENDRKDLCKILYDIWKEDNKNITEQQIYSNLFGENKDEFSYEDVKNIISANNNNTISIDNSEYINNPLNKTQLLFNKTKDILSDDDRATIEFIMQKTINNYEKNKGNKE